MTKLETLIVPEELGKWLRDNELGDSRSHVAMIVALNYYWDTIFVSPLGEFIAENKKELIEVIIGSREYKVEEPLYYALIKGHELIAGEDACKYWKCDMRNGSMFLSNRYSHYGRYLAEMSKSEWNKLGINDSNADFFKVKE